MPLFLSRAAQACPPALRPPAYLYLVKALCLVSLALLALGGMAPAAQAQSPPSPVLTTITVSPANVLVATGTMQQFTATADDQNGSPLATQPAFTWTVSGGQSIGTNGWFTAGSSAGGPYTVTAASGSVSGTATLTVTPPGPAGLTAAGASTSQINLAWGAVTGATGYKVERSPDGVNGWTQIAAPTAAAYSDTGLTAGTLYSYRVRATLSTGDTAAGSAASAVTTAAQPTGLTATPGNRTISLNWPGEDGGYSYNLYRGTTPGGEGTTPTKTGLNSTPFVDTGLTDGTTYYYQISAVNDSGESVLSAEVSATPAPPPAPPSSTLTSAQAIALAQAFCQAISAPVTATPTATWPAPNRTPSQQAYHWQPRWLIQFPGQAEVEVVDATSVISHYYNLALSQQMLTANQPAGTPVPESSARSTATTILVASKQPLVELASSPTDQNFQITDPPTQAGDLWMVTWARQYGNVPYRQEQATVMLQAETGAVQAFSLSFPAAPPSASVGLVTSSQAAATAQTLLTNAGVTGTTQQSVTQQVVQPNTYWQTGGTATPSPNAAGQVAWNCVYTDANSVIYEVWVSASSGGVIGGESYGIAGTRRGSAKHPLTPKRPGAEHLSKKAQTVTAKPVTAQAGKKAVQ